MTSALLVGTRKGAFVLTTDDRGSWSISEPMFLGHICQHLVLDPRDQRTLLLAASTGHLGPTVFRSNDLGASWQEARIARQIAVRNRFMVCSRGPERRDRTSHAELSHLLML